MYVTLCSLSNMALLATGVSARVIYSCGSQMEQCCRQLKGCALRCTVSSEGAHITCALMTGELQHKQLQVAESGGEREHMIDIFLWPVTPA